MEGKEDIQESLVVREGMIVKYPWSQLPLLQLLLKGSVQQEEVKQPHFIDTQRPKTMNYLVTPEATNHLQLATLPCLTEQCNHCGKNFSRKSSPSKHMLVVHGARRVRFVKTQNSKLKTRISLKKRGEEGCSSTGPWT